MFNIPHTLHNDNEIDPLYRLKNLDLQMCFFFLKKTWNSHDYENGKVCSLLNCDSTVKTYEIT